jgi:ubiquinone/menaquinone biosynthesis C-methylase UbiE
MSLNKPNKIQIIKEIRRVLKPGGKTLHIIETLVGLVQLAV